MIYILCIFEVHISPLRPYCGPVSEPIELYGCLVFRSKQGPSTMSSKYFLLSMICIPCLYQKFWTRSDNQNHREDDPEGDSTNSSRHAIQHNSAISKIAKIPIDIVDSIGKQKQKLYFLVNTCNYEFVTVFLQLLVVRTAQHSENKCGYTTLTPVT